MNKEKRHLVKTTHLCVNINRALQELKEGNNLFEPSTPTEVMHELLNAQKEGKTFYSGCSKMTKEGRCAGHIKYVKSNQTDILNTK